MLILCLWSPGIHAQTDPNKKNVTAVTATNQVSCLCGADLDTVFMALNFGLKAVRAGQQLQARFDSLKATVPKTLQQYEDKIVKQDKELKQKDKVLIRTEKSRNFWRATTVVALITGLIVSVVQ